MPKIVLLDEWQITFRIPDNLPDADVRAVRRVLNSNEFTAAVRRMVAITVRGNTVLEPVRTAFSF